MDGTTVHELMLTVLLEVGLNNTASKYWQLDSLLTVHAASGTFKITNGQTSSTIIATKL